MSKKTKKITFLSLVIFIVGSTIGSGIFIKNTTILKYNGGNLIFTSISWALALIGFFALVLTLFEMCQGAKEENTNGIPGWCKTYNNNFIAKSAMSFTTWLYLPTSHFFMPIYCVDQLSSAMGWNIPWWLGLLISLIIFVYFILTSGRSARISVIQNYIITYVKVLPLVFACIIGFVALGTNQAVFDHSQIEKSASYFVNLAPVIGISLSIPAIYFGFDGFFTATSLYEEVENKSTFSKAMIVGTLIVTAIYLLCSISLIFLNVNGALEETPPLVTKGLSIFLNTCISISIFGVLNGCAYYGTIIFFDAIKNNEVPFAKRFKRQVSANNVKIGMYYSLAVYLIYFLVCSFIGIFYYSNYTNYGATDATGITFGSLLTASDDFSNWTSLISFLFIAIAAMGCLKKRKNPESGIKKTWYFVPCCIVAFGFCVLCFGMVCVQTIFDLIYYLVNDRNNPNVSLASFIMPIVCLVSCVLGAIVPPLFMKKKGKVALKH